MSTKEWVYNEGGVIGLFRELSFDDDNDSPAVIEVANPTDFELISFTNDKGFTVGRLKIEIPAEVFDELAVAWCKARELNRS